MSARFLPFLLLGWTLISHGAVPDFTVTRTGALFFAASDLTTNGVPGLSNGASDAVVSRVPGYSTQGGRLAVVNTQVWARFYKGPHNYDQAGSVALDVSGNVIVTGYSEGASSDFDFATVKYSSSGTPLWTNRYDGPAHGIDLGGQVTVDPGGNVYVAGQSGYLPNDYSAMDGVVVKYSPDGTLLWTNRFNYFGTNYSSAGIAVSASNVYVSLYTYPARPGFLIVKLDASGTPAWTNVYQHDAFGENFVAAMAVDSVGDLLVTGYSSTRETGADYATLKYSSAGVPLWTNRYHRTFGDQPSALVVDGAGRAIVSGDASADAYATVAYSSDGQPLWTNLLAHPNYLGGSVPRVVADVLGNVFVTGGSAEANGTDADFTTVKIASNGVPVWTNRFLQVNVGNPSPGGTAADSAGNFYFTGHSTEQAGTQVGTGWDFVTVKYAADGTPVWTNRFNGPANDDDIPNAMAVDRHGHVYVCGDTTPAGGGVWNYATVKYVEYIHYTPPPNFVGTDTFQFVATDSSGASATNTVTIRVEAESLWFNPLRSTLRVTGNEQRRLHLDSVRTNRPVVLYASFDLVSWTPFATNTPVADTVEFLVPAFGLRQFYRAVQP